MVICSVVIHNCGRRSMFCNSSASVSMLSQLAVYYVALLYSAAVYCGNVFYDTRAWLCPIVLPCGQGFLKEDRMIGVLLYCCIT